MSTTHNHTCESWINRHTCHHLADFGQFVFFSFSAPNSMSNLRPSLTRRKSGGSMKSKFSSSPKPKLCICRITDAKLVRLISGSVNSGRLKSLLRYINEYTHLEQHDHNALYVDLLQLVKLPQSVSVARVNGSYNEIYVQSRYQSRSEY